MFEASVWKRLQPAADFRQEEKVRRQEKQDVPVADDRPVFFLAKWVSREGSRETFRDQFLSFFPELFFFGLHSFWIGDKLLEKLSGTSIENLADFSCFSFKLPGTYCWYG
jgi:hypothetical protein